MSKEKQPDDEDFSEFWVRPIRPNGEPSGWAHMDEGAFSDKYGERAADAYSAYAHGIQITYHTQKTWQNLMDAIETIEKIVGVHPSKIAAGSNNARIEGTDNTGDI